MALLPKIKVLNGDLPRFMLCLIGAGDNISSYCYDTTTQMISKRVACHCSYHTLSYELETKVITAMVLPKVL